MTATVPLAVAVSAAANAARTCREAGLPDMTGVYCALIGYPDDRVTDALADLDSAAVIADYEAVTARGVTPADLADARDAVVANIRANAA